LLFTLTLVILESPIPFWMADLIVSTSGNSGIASSNRYCRRTVAAAFAKVL